MVTVDDDPAACMNLNCGYKYVETEAELTSQQLSGRDLSLTGTNLPTDVHDVKLGGASCGGLTSDGTSIQCSLKSDPAAGSHSMV